jgi:hypothetical protein
MATAAISQGKDISVDSQFSGVAARLSVLTI